MNAQELVKQIQEKYSEWSEMSPDPAAFVAGIMADRILKLESEVKD